MLQETASKEAAMATRIEEVQAELKQARLALSNSHAEIDRLGVFSTQLKKVSDVRDHPGPPLLLLPSILPYTECSENPLSHNSRSEINMSF